jgi:hypothetical protein
MERISYKAANGNKWCETNHLFPTSLSDYCFMKYPIS